MPVFPSHGGSRNSWGTELRNFFSPFFNLTTGIFEKLFNNIESISKYASLSAAVTAIGANEKTLVIDTNTVLAANTTIPANISIEVKKGGLITKASTYTLTINGPFSAGLYQVFSGFSAGDVTGLKEIKGEWFGAKADGVTDSTSAWAVAVPSGYVLSLEPGTYKGNFPTITTTATQKLTVRGAGRRATLIKPASNIPVIKIDSTNGAIQGIVIEDLGLDNTGTGFTSSGIQITGTNINDWHNLRRLFITGFQNGLLINGRSIWSKFDDIEIISSLDHGIKVSGNSDTMAFNLNSFRNVRSASNVLDGFYIEDTGGGGSPGFYTNSWDSCNFESNTRHGFFVNGGNGGLSGGGIYNSYIEANGDTGFKATGTLLIGFSFNNNLCWSSGGTYDYYNAVTLSTGEVKGNRWSKGAYFALASDSGFIEYGMNYGPAPVITADVNGRKHVNITTPLAYTDGATQITNPVAVSALTIGASPYQYTNTAKYDVDLFYVGGNVTQVYLNRGAWGGDYVPLNSIYRLSPGDIIYFTYTVVPTNIWLVPR